MAELKILIYKGGAAEPDSKVIVPIKALRLVTRLLPGKVADALAKEGIDLEAVAAAASAEQPIGTLIEVESPDERIVVLIE
jgi:hypothetical protein